VAQPYGSVHMNERILGRKEWRRMLSMDGR